MTTSTDQYDAIIIGAGQGGGPLSTALARAGWRTAIIEQVHVGGTCVNEGCTPTKTMVASARVAYLARRGADYGVRSGGPVTVDLARVRQRKRDIVDSFRSGVETRLGGAQGLDLLRGHAELDGPGSVAVALNDGTRRVIHAGTIVINAGARPAVPPLDGLDSVPHLDSTSIMELDTVPEHLLVLGGGYVGLEFGQMFRRFGARVTVVQRPPVLLSREDPDVCQAVAAIMREDGLELVLDAEAFRASAGPDGGVRLDMRVQGETRSVEGTHLLVSTGRTPNTDRLGLEAAGVEIDARGFIKVDEQLRTNVPGIYAIGDVNGGPAFTHISYDDFRIVRANLLEHAGATTKGRLVPYAVFIDPQLGRIGMGETEAMLSGRRVRVAKLPMSHVARALEVDESRGFMKAIVDAESGEILGCAVLGIEGGELMAMMQVAMMGHLRYTALRDGVFAHPTLGEALNNLFATLD